MVAIKVGPPTKEAVDSGFDRDKMIDYQKQVMGILDTIAINPIGRVITDFILKHTKTVSIEPLYKSQSKVASVGEDNATTNPVRGREQDSAPKGASDRGPIYWYAGKPDSIYTRGEDERDEKVPPDSSEPAPGVMWSSILRLQTSKPTGFGTDGPITCSCTSWFTHFA